MTRRCLEPRHGLSEAEVDRILTELLRNAAVREPVASSHSAPDRGDQHLWDLLVAQRRAVLVTGDRRLLESPPHEARVMSPDAFARQHPPPARRSGS